MARYLPKVCSVIIVILLTLQKSATEKSEYQTIVLLGNYSTDITVAVDSNKEYIIHFKRSGSVYPYTVFTSSCEASVDYPVFIMVRQQREATSWEIPLLGKSNGGTVRFHNVSRTLCHNSINAIAHIPAHQLYNYNSLKVEHSGFHKYLTLSVSTVSKFPTNVTVRVEEDTGFFITENQTYSLTISPSQPKYFYYKYDQEKDNAETNTVILEVDSKDETCLTVSIQNATCPVFDLNEDITYEGKYQTVNRKGGVIIKKNEFPKGFFVVFVAKGDNYDCDGKRSLIPVVESDINNKPINYSSVVMFKIKADITRIDYLKYTFLTLGILLGFFILFGGIAFASLYLQIKHRTRFDIQANVQPENDNADSAPLLNHFIDTVFSDTQEIVVEPGPSNLEVIEENRDVDFQSCITNSTNAVQNAQLESSCEIKARRLKLTEPTLHDLIIKKPRTIYKESTNYCLNVITIAIFYGIPVVQLVIIHQRLISITGDLDVCYYNFLCAHPYGIFNDYNHVLSNVGYILFGILFLLITVVREFKMPFNENCGIPKHYGIFYAMGIALTMEGFLSGCYHICPNQSNFQFDTSFMYVMAVMCIIKLYQTRHPGINANAYFAFLLLAFAILIAMVGILDGHLWIWIVFIISYTGLCIFLAIKIYFINESRIGLALFLENRRNEGLLRALRPLRIAWCKYLIGAIVVNIILVSMGYLFFKYNIGFGTFLLFLLMGNAVIYTFFYVVMKFITSRYQKKNGKEPSEQPTLESLCYLLLSAITWGVALKFFLHNSSQWMVSAAESRQRNTECVVMDFFDDHDVWHLTSASALFFSFMMLLTVDDNLVFTPRDEIVVF